MIIIRAEQQAVLQRYCALEARIDEIGLDGVWLLKPLLNVSQRATLVPPPTAAHLSFTTNEYTRCRCRCRALTAVQGTQLMKELGLPMGPAVGQVLEAQIQWQIRERSSDVAACLQHLRAEIVPVLLADLSQS